MGRTTVPRQKTLGILNVGAVPLSRLGRPNFPTGKWKDLTCRERKWCFSVNRWFGRFDSPISDREAIRFLARPGAKVSRKASGQRPNEIESDRRSALFLF